MFTFSKLSTQAFCHHVAEAPCAGLAVLAAMLAGATVPTVTEAALAPPSHVRVTDHDAVSVQLAWDSTAPADGYTTYSVYADGVLVYLTPATVADFSGLTPGATYELTVTVERPNQPESAPSVPVRVTMDADTQPPATPANFRLEQRSSPPTTLRFNWDWTTDNTGSVPQWELSYAGNTVLISHTYPGHTQNVAELDLGPGNAYAFELRAIDAAGNRSTAPARLVFETTPPGRASNLRQLSTRQGYPEIIAWDPAPDNSGTIRTHEILLNGQSLGTTGSGRSQVDLLEQIFNVACITPPSGPASVQVRAIDPSLNAGELSAVLTVVFP